MEAKKGNFQDGRKRPGTIPLMAMKSRTSSSVGEELIK